MIVFIRADASKLIGSGHVMRCLTLADMLAQKAHQVNFICRDLPGNLINQIQDRGYQCRMLPFTSKQKADYEQLPLNDDYELWRGVTLEEDYIQTQQLLIGISVDLLVVDHYSLDYHWHKKLRPLVNKIMVIDDLANRYYDCDIILDHNFHIDYQKRYDGLVAKNIKKLLGPKHALISSQLMQVKDKRAVLKKGLCLETIGDILVFLGGMDAKNFTQMAIDKLLATSRFYDAEIHVVLGENNPNQSLLMQRYIQYNRITFYIQPDNYYDLLVKADLAVGAGGVSQLERSFIQLPSFIVCIADNQKDIVKSSIKAGISKDLNLINSLDNAFSYIETTILDINEVSNC